MRPTRSALLFIAAIGATACKSSDRAPAASSGTAAPSAKPAPVPAPAPSAKPAPAPAPAADHLQAAQAAEKAKDWATATKELDAAIAAKPDDAATLSELTWAAFHAGQVDHARDVGVKAVLAARKANKPKLEAMALYNLGLAEQKADNHAARSLFKASLDLRPNDTVTKSLEDAGEDGDATPAGDALLAQLGVTRIEDNRKTPEKKADTQLLAALQAGGVDFDMGAGHGAINQDIDCVIALDPAQDQCDYVSGDDTPVALHVKGAKATAVIKALEASGAKTNGSPLKVNVDCETIDEGMADGLTPADSCDVTMR